MHQMSMAAAVAAFLHGPDAFAQADNFLGWSFGVNANSASTWTEFIGGSGSKVDFKLRDMYSPCISSQATR